MPEFMKYGRLTSPKCEARHADPSHAPADDVDRVRLERLVDLVPNEPRPDLRGLAVWVVDDLAEAVHGDLHAFRGRKARVRRVPAALHL